MRRSSGIFWLESRDGMTSYGPIRNTLWKRVNEVEAVPFYFLRRFEIVLAFNPFQSDVGAIEAQLDLQIPAVKRNPNHAEPMTREDLAENIF